MPRTIPRRERELLLDFHVKKTLGVDPYVLLITVLSRELQLVCVAAFYFFHSLELPHFRSLRRVVNQGTIHLRLLRLGLGLLCGERLYFIPVQEGTNLPSVGSVVNLHRSLTSKLDLHP